MGARVQADADRRGSAGILPKAVAMTEEAGCFSRSPAALSMLSVPAAIGSVAWAALWIGSYFSPKGELAQIVWWTLAYAVASMAVVGTFTGLAALFLARRARLSRWQRVLCLAVNGVWLFATLVTLGRFVHSLR